MFGFLPNDSASLRFAGAAFALLHGAGCVRSPENSPCAQANNGSPNQFMAQAFFNQQISSRSKPVIMSLIELAPRGKDVSLSLTLPEETANDLKLYARFLHKDKEIP
jgi:hypothetical protein